MSWLLVSKNCEKSLENARRALNGLVEEQKEHEKVDLSNLNSGSGDDKITEVKDSLDKAFEKASEVQSASEHMTMVILFNIVNSLTNRNDFFRFIRDITNIKKS